MNSLRLVCCFCLVVGLLLNTASGQEDPENQGVRPAAPGTAEFERELEQMRLLTLPFKVQWAQQVLKFYPESDFARVFRRMLVELEEIDKAPQDDPRFRHLPARTAVDHSAPPLTIHNSTGEPVLLQIKGPGMLWTRPLILRADSSFTINYPVLHRRFIDARETIHSLSLGKRYEFRMPEGSDTPRLFTVD